MMVLSSTTFSNGFMPSKSLPGDKVEEARTLYLNGKEAHANENYDDAVRSFTKAVYLQEQLYGKFFVDTVKTYWRLGRSASKAQQQSVAVEAFHRAMRTAETTFDDSVVLSSLCNDVESMWVGDNSKEETRSPSTDNDEDFKSSQFQQFERLLSLEKEGDAACKRRKYGDAIESYQQALQILANVAGSSDTLCGADLRVKQSTCYMKNKQPAEAAEALSAAHECFRRRLGDSHPATLGAAATLKTLHKNSFQNKEGEKWWTASLSSLGSNVSKRSVAREETSSPVTTSQ